MTRVFKISFGGSRLANDPFLVGKLFEFLRNRYTGQLITGPRGHVRLHCWARIYRFGAVVLRHLRNEFCAINKGLFADRYFNTVSKE